MDTPAGREGFLGLTGLMAGGSVSLTAFQAEGCDGTFGAALWPRFRKFKKFGLPLAGWFRRWQRLTPQFYNATLQAVMGVLKLKGRLL